MSANFECEEIFTDCWSLLLSSFQALTTIINSLEPGSIVQVRLRVPTSSTSSLLSKTSGEVDPEANQQKPEITFEIVQIPSSSGSLASSSSSSAQEKDPARDFLSEDETMNKILSRLDGSLKTETIASSQEDPSSNQTNSTSQDSISSPPPTTSHRVYHLSLPLNFPDSHFKSQVDGSNEGETSQSETKSQFNLKRNLSSTQSQDLMTTDPTLDVLVSFVLNHLRGHFLALHSDSNSSFGDEISKQLTGWGCDVARIPIKNRRRSSSISVASVESKAKESELKGLKPEEIEEILNRELGGVEGGDESASSDHPNWEKSHPLLSSANGTNSSIRKCPLEVKDQVGGLDQVEEKSPRLAAAISAKDGRPSLVSFPSDLVLDPRRSESLEENSQDGISVQADPQERHVILDPMTGVPITASMDPKSPASPNQRLRVQWGPEENSGTSSQSNRRRSTSASLVPFSFVLIDDDLDTLQKELLKIKSAVPLLRSALSGGGIESSSPKSKATRPPLQHRPRSSPQIQKVLSLEPRTASSKGASNGWADNASDTSASLRRQSPLDDSTCAIIFLTSLSNYRLSKELLEPILQSSKKPIYDEHGVLQSTSNLPEISVILKPSGARRILTTMHSSVVKPRLDAVYQPIAAVSSLPLNSMISGRRREGSDDSSIANTPLQIGTPRGFNQDTFHSSNLTAEALEESQKSSKSSAKEGNVSLTDLPRFKVDGADSAKSGKQDKGHSSSDLLPPSSMGLIPAELPSTSDGISPSSVVVSGGPTDQGSSTGAVGQASPGRSLPSSPMPVDALEYFTETAARMGNSAASGMVIQSPDGRPAGIFFRPQNTKHHTGGTASRSSTPGGGTGSRRSSSESGVVASGGVAATGQTLSPTAEGNDDHRTMSPETLLQQQSPSSPGSVNGNASESRSAPPSKLLRSRTSSSIQTTDTSTPSLSGSSTARSGSLFSPQVALESIMNGSQPPVTTPLALAFRGTPDPSSKNGDGSTTFPPPSPRSALPSVPSSPKSNAVSNSGFKTSEVEANGSEKGQKEKAGSETSAAANEQKTEGSLQVPPIQAGGGDSGSKIGGTQNETSSSSTPRTDTTNPAASRLPPKNGVPANNAAKLNAMSPANQARQTFAASTPAQAANGTVAARPSAMPQSGLLIGAGFAPKHNNRSGPKKAPVREVILPPIKVLIVEGKSTPSASSS